MNWRVVLEKQIQLLEAANDKIAEKVRLDVVGADEFRKNALVIKELIEVLKFQ